MTRAVPHRRPAIRLGISRCLLGDPVRYDGGHKQHRFLTEVLGRHVRWVPVCPEVEAGLGTPRPAMHLVGSAAAPRIVTIAGGEDRTTALEQMARRRLPELEELDLSGFVFKSRSPSCGAGGVPLYAGGRVRSRRGAGLFAAQVRRRWPLLPVEEEDQFDDPACCDHFLERIVGYVRWRGLTRARVTRKTLAAFHERHRYVLLAHSKAHHDKLNRLVRGIAKDRTGRPPRSGLIQSYGRLFMEALAVRPTIGTHIRVLRNISSHFSGRLSVDESRQLKRAIAEYRRGRKPLDAPLALVKRYARRYRLRDPALRMYLHSDARRLALAQQARSNKVEPRG